MRSRLALLAVVVVVAGAGCRLRRACDGASPCPEGAACIDFYCADDVAADAGVVDAGVVEEDAGVVDAGVVDHDAGVVDADAGVVDVDAGSIVTLFVDDFDRDASDGWGQVNDVYGWRVNNNGAGQRVSGGAGIFDTGVSAAGFTGAVVQEGGVDDELIGVALEGTVRVQYRGDGQAGSVDFVAQIHRTDAGRYELDLGFAPDGLHVHVDRRSGGSGVEEVRLTDDHVVPGDFHDRPIDFYFGFSTTLQQYEVRVVPDGGEAVAFTLPAPTSDYLPSVGIMQLACATSGSVVVAVDRVAVLDIE